MHSSLVYPLSFLFSFEVSDYRSRVLSQYAVSVSARVDLAVSENSLRSSAELNCDQLLVLRPVKRLR